MKTISTFKGFRLGQKVIYKGQETHIIGFHFENSNMNICVFDSYCRTSDFDTRTFFKDEIEEGSSVFTEQKEGEFIIGKWVSENEIKPIEHNYHILYYTNRNDIYCKGVNVKAESLVHALSIFNANYPNIKPVSISLKNQSLEKQILNKQKLN